MIYFKFSSQELDDQDQEAINLGFKKHSKNISAPKYESKKINWIASNDRNETVGAITCKLLWDWIYIDELWIDEKIRGKGYGKQLIELVEEYANKNKLQGIWLWTQSWQAEDFYINLGYEEFTRFQNFPKGYERIGFRKYILTTSYSSPLKSVN